jgi:hypothetical protein
MPNLMRLLLCLCVLLAGPVACTFGYQETTSGASTEAAPGVQTDREACINSCNSSHTVCMDSGAAHRDRGDVPAIFGASASCDESLRKCLPACKGR